MSSDKIYKTVQILIKGETMYVPLVNVFLKASQNEAKKCSMNKWNFQDISQLSCSSFRKCQRLFVFKISTRMNFFANNGNILYITVQRV